MVKERSVMKVRDIISLFDVSAATIRKDLTLLEESGLLRRTRGEVHAIAPNGLQMTPFEARSFFALGPSAKLCRQPYSKAMTAKASFWIPAAPPRKSPNFWWIAKKLTMITNSLPVALALSSSAVTVIVVGGMFLGQSISIQGPDADS